MNINDMYENIRKQLNINLNNIKDNIKNNEIQSLNLMIIELQEKRNLYIKKLSNDSTFQNRYRGEVLSTNSSIWSDFDKSIEYEAILLSIVNLLDNKENISSLIKFNNTFNYSLNIDEKNKIIDSLSKQLEDKNKCSICLENNISNCCIPSGHTYCTSCINKTNNCYICRSIITNKIKIYL